MLTMCSCEDIPPKIYKQKSVKALKLHKGFNQLISETLKQKCHFNFKISKPRFHYFVFYSKCQKHIKDMFLEYLTFKYIGNLMLLKVVKSLRKSFEFGPIFKKIGKCYMKFLIMSIFWICDQNENAFWDLATFVSVTVVGNRNLINGSMYVLTLNFEIPQVAYF